MRAFHNSRDIAYRAPFGAIAVGASTALTLDVWDAPRARVALRTWVDGKGEGLYEMGRADVDGSDDCGNAHERFSIEFTPEEAGVVWYQFVITDEHGGQKRYGAQDGRMGGIGQLLDWEPPSFKLTVLDSGETRGEAEEEGELCDFPFTDDVIRFMRGEMLAGDLVEAIETFRENSLQGEFDRPANLLGGRSDECLLAQLSGAAPVGGADAELFEGVCLDNSKRGLGKGRMWCASLIQMLMPAGTTVYSGVDGGAGGSYTAFSEDADRDCETIVRNAYDIRCALPLFTAGSFSCFSVGDDVFGIYRGADDGTSACLLINSSLCDAHDVDVPLMGESVSEIIGGYGLPVLDADEVDAANRACINRVAEADAAEGEGAARYVRAHLYQVGSAILYFHPEQRLNQPMEAGLGVLAHITSLSTASSKSKGARQQPGTLGAPARRFVDWLAKAGVRYWQVLPVNPTDEHGSPYAGISAFAGNTRLLERGTDADGKDSVALEDPDGYRDFCEREKDWLEPYASFMAIRQKVGAGVVWQKWPKKYRSFDPAIVEADSGLLAFAESWRRAQFAFERQWEDLRAYANERGVQIIGDMPIYVSSDSADVWANPDMFQLGSDGNPEVVAGCPPDRFAEEGQIWGNPIYDWDALRENGYGWWLRRLERAFELYDLVRLDHFIGFSRYFSIPAGEKATAGVYRPGPGLDFFCCAQKAFGPLPVIAEDLGSITPAVRALGAACGFPGMDIVQFVDGNDPLAHYQPRPEKIAYTGTHDNQTLVGYACERYPDLDAEEVARQLAKKVVESSAPVCVLQLQDLIGLDDDARMNVPGTAEGNWTWQAKPRDVDDALDYARELVEIHRDIHI